MSQTLHISSTIPEADGIMFDETYGLPDKVLNMIASRGLIYTTSFKANGKTYSGKIFAANQKSAEDVAFGRGLAEEVDGQLVSVGKTKHVPRE